MLQSLLETLVKPDGQPKASVLIAVVAPLSAPAWWDKS